MKIIPLHTAYTSFIIASLIMLYSLPIASMNKHSRKVIIKRKQHLQRNNDFDTDLYDAINSRNRTQLLLLLTNENILQNNATAALLKDTCDGNIQHNSPFFNLTTWNNFVPHNNINKTAFLHSAIYLVSIRSSVTAKLSTAARLSRTYNHLMKLQNNQE